MTDMIILWLWYENSEKRSNEQLDFRLSLDSSCVSPVQLQTNVRNLCADSSGLCCVAPSRMALDSQIQYEQVIDIADLFTRLLQLLPPLLLITSCRRQCGGRSPIDLIVRLCYVTSRRYTRVIIIQSVQTSSSSRWRRRRAKSAVPLRAQATSHSARWICVRPRKTWTAQPTASSPSASCPTLRPARPLVNTSIIDGYLLF